MMENALKQVVDFTNKFDNQLDNQQKEVVDLLKSSENNHLQENEVWLTVEEVDNLLGVSKQAVQKAIKAGKYRVRRDLSDGRKPYRIALSSLPLKAQVEWAERHRSLGAGEGVRREMIDPVTLSSSEREYCLAMGAVLKLYVEAIEGVGFGRVMEAKRSFVARYNGGEWQTLARVIKRVSWQTLDRQLKRWKEAGYDCFALARKYRRASEKMAIERTTLTEEQRKILIRLALSPNAPALSRVIESALREFMEKGYGVVSAMTCRRFLEAWKREKYSVWVFAREGEKGLNDKVLPFIERNPESIEVGDVVVMDGWKTDFDLINPRTGRACRGVIVSAMDMRSGMVLGWEVMVVENVMAIAAALRRAILRLGFMPRVIYIDNGKAFRAKFFQGVKDFKETVINGLFDRFRDFGFKGVTYAWAYHGQSKTIEPFHREYAAMAREVPTYRGNTPLAKPPRLNRGERVHRKLYEDFVGGYVPTIEEVHWATAEWLDRYARRPSRGKYCGGRAPIEVFEESLARVRKMEGFENRVISKEQLNYLMMAEERVAVYRNGIRFRGKNYYNDALLDLEKGDKRYKILYDIEEDDKVYVYREDGKFVCVAVAMEQVHAMAKLSLVAKDHEELARQIEMKREAKSQTIREAKELLEGEMEGIVRKVKKMSQMSSTGTDSVGELGYVDLNDREILVNGKVIRIF